MKKTILIDLDGVLNKYTGNFEPEVIPQMNNGAYKFLEKLHEKFEIKLFTTRNKLLAAKWIISNNLDEFVSDITIVKDPAWLIIDDRCINFRGDYEDTLNKIEHFNVWYK